MEGMEILVLGDGAYVFAVLNAVASINSYNILGALGAVIGIILMAIKGVSAQGGPSLNPAAFLISIVLFWIIFVPRADRVVVQEIMVQPGNVAPRTFVVDNVPFGLAAAGFMMSQLGAKFTQIYETNFGSAEDNQRGTTGGLGRNLALLTSFQTMLSDPRFTDPPKANGEPGFLDTYRANMLTHFRMCVMPNLHHGRMSISAVMNAPGIEGVINPVTANKAINLEWKDANGSSRTVTCADANDLISQVSDSPQLTAAVDAAFKMRGDPTNHRQVQMAFSQFTNNNAMHMGTMVSTSILNSLVNEARVRGSLSPADAQAVVMLEEASRKRNVQWAAEENLFIRILRPIVGFFEAMFYALAPIIAFVVTMGPFGWGLVGKYAMLTVWVGLWFPMLAITQLYSNVQMKYFFERIGDTNSSGDLVYSPEQLNQIGLQAMDALGSASALAAATPALAMSLIFGGAVSMSYLAGRLQGSDMIDEKKVSPDASTVAPVASWGSAGTGSIGTGTTVNGASMKQISAQDAGQIAESFGRQAMHSQAREFSNTLSEAVQKNASVMSAASAMVSSGWTQAHNQGFDASVQRAFEEGTIGKDDMKVLTSLSQDQKAQLSVGVSAFGSGASKAFTDGSNDTEQWGSSAERSAAAKLAQSQSATTGISLNTASAMQNSKVSTSQVGLSASEGQALSDASKEAYQTSQTYQSTASITSTLSSTESLTYAQMGQNFVHTHGDNAAAELQRIDDLIRDAGYGEALDQNLASYQARGGLGEPEHTRLAAYYDTLKQARASGGNADELFAAQSSIISSSFNSANAGAALGAGGIVGGGRETAGGISDVTSSVSSATSGAHGLSGPGVSSDQVFGGANSGIASTGGAVDAGHAAQAGLPSNGQVELSGAQQDLAKTGLQGVNDTNTRQHSATEAAGRHLIGDVSRLNNNWSTDDPAQPASTMSPVEATHR